jgi:DNA-binding NarL/FixJ family response regulator
VVSGVGLVGRDHEVSLLAGLLDGVATGRGSVVWVEGEPGIGKSALLSVLRSRATLAGCLVRSGAGDELAGAFPLRLMADCLGVTVRSEEPLVAEIARLLRGELVLPGAVDPAAAAGERILELVDKWCAAGPVVLVAEDLHWADEASVELWGRLARSVDQIPLLLVGSCRPVPRRPVLDRLSVVVRDLGGTVLRLGPLSAEDAAELARDRLGAPPGPGLKGVLARAGGNSLYLRELLDALLADDSVIIVDGIAELDAKAEALPGSLRAALGRRLGFLSEPTLRALRLAALLGVEFSAVEWAAVSGCSAGELGDMVSEATLAGVIVADQTRLAFRHDLIRQVLVDQTPPSLRSLFHTDTAFKLAQAGIEVDAVARHLLAGKGLQDWALTWLANLREPKVSLAPQVSQELLSRAVDQIDTSDARWEVLASRLAQLQYRLGHDDAAGRTSLAVLRRTADVEVAGQMRVQAVRAAGRTGRYDEAVALAESGFVDPTTPPHWRARLRAWAANGIHALGATGEAYQMAQAALGEAVACGDQIGAGYARFFLSQWSDGVQRRRYAEQALAELGDDSESVDLRLLILWSLLSILEDSGAADEVDNLLPQALEAAERVGNSRAYWLRSAAAWISYTRGDWDEGLRHMAVIPETFETLATETCAYRAEIALRRDQRALADTYLRAAGVPDRPEEAPFTPRIRELSSPLMLRAEADGDYERALSHGKELLTVPLPYTMDACFTLHLVRIAQQVGDIATATAAADWAAHSRYPATNGARCGSAVNDRDEEALLGLAEEYQRRGWRTLRAFALEEAAVLLACRGAVDQARAALTGAVQLYIDFGASLDVRRARSRLRAHGVRIGARSISRRVTKGWEALTPTEQRIAALVGEGLSNPDIASRLFVSRATVQTHVSRILTKLNVKSRVELIKSAWG